MSDLAISNVVTVSIATPPAGLSDYKINNLLILTKEVPVNSPGSFGVYRTPTDVGDDWGTDSEVYAMANLIFSQSPNILAGGGELLIAQQDNAETLAVAIARLNPLVFFGGILSAGYAASDAEILAAAIVVQPLNKMLFASSYLTASVDTDGLFDQIQKASETNTRGLLYTTSAAAARLFAAAYAGRAMSVDFDGAATTITMHLKDLVGIEPDGGITQTVLNKCKTVGADVYASIGGLPKVFCTGGNDFYDNVYNLNWLVFALTVAGFNALAETSTKLPQTEPGMAVLKGAYIDVLQRAVRNGFIAPGAWNSPQLFGDPVALVRNILEQGWYIYSTPVNLQSQTQREARQAPLVQTAIKFAGAIQSTSIVVNFNP